MKKRLFYMLFVPSLSLIIFFLVFPLLVTILPTFLGTRGISLERYSGFFSDAYFFKIFVRTLRISLLASVVCALMGVPVAYFISKSSQKIRGLLIACTVFPLLTNAVVRSFAWMNLLGKNGVVNKILIAMKIIHEPHQFLYTEFAMIVGSTYIFLPLMVVSLVGVMENIESELLEAAESLGASRIKAFFKIIFPLSIPGLIVGSVLVFTGTLTAYTTPQLLGGNKNMVLATLIYQRTMSLNDWNSASVIATIMIVTTLLVIQVINKLAARLNERGV